MPDTETSFERARREIAEIHATHPNVNPQAMTNAALLLYANRACVFEPGDGTRYEMGWVRATHGMSYDLIATRSGQYGTCYPWHQERVHWNYVQEKWGAGNAHSGRIYAYVLNRMHELIAGS